MTSTSHKATNFDDHSQRFRWRTLPVAFIGGMGAIYCAMGIGGFLLMAITSWTGEPLYEPGPPPGFSELGSTVAGFAVFCGGLLVLAAHQLWKWRWKTALGILATCVIATQIAKYFEWFPE